MENNEVIAVVVIALGIGLQVARNHYKFTKAIDTINRRLKRFGVPLDKIKK